MKISDPLVVPTLPEEMMMMGANMPPELVSIFLFTFRLLFNNQFNRSFHLQVMQLVQVSSAFLVTLNSYVASTREIDRRARRLRRSRMLLLMRLMHLRENKQQRSLMPMPPPIPRVVRPPPIGNKYSISYNLYQYLLNNILLFFFSL